MTAPAGPPGTTGAASRVWPVVGILAVVLVVGFFTLNIYLATGAVAAGLFLGAMVATAAVIVITARVARKR